MFSSKSSLRQILLDFPNQFKRILTAAKGVKAAGNFDKLVVCGMGGSALPADIIKAYLAGKKVNLPIFISRDYHLPWQADVKSLIFISSYSGNTEETLACFQEAKKRGLKMVSFAKGGKLLEMCRRDKIPFVQYPEEVKDFQPRLALGYAFGAMLRVLINCGLIFDFSREIDDFVFRFQPADFENLGKKLARKAKNFIPVFYASSQYGECLARICKIMVNENAKTPAFWNVFPEMNHNEMVGFTKLNGQFHLIILADKNEDQRILKRMRIVSGLLKKKGLLISEAPLIGQSVLEKIFNALMVGAWFSYYLALANKQDPLPVKMVEDFKKRMS